MTPRVRTAVLCTLLLVAPAACGDITSIEAELTPEVLAGDWEATTLNITNLANPSESLDLLAEGGALTLRFTLDGRATQFLTTPEGETLVSEGTYEIDPPFLLLGDDSGVDAYAYELQSSQTGNSLTIATSDLVFDFQGDGEPDPALFAGVLIR